MRDGADGSANRSQAHDTLAQISHARRWRNAKASPFCSDHQTLLKLVLDKLPNRIGSMSLLRKLGGASLLGALAYTTCDAASETMMYIRAKQLVEQRVHDHAALRKELGDNLQLGPWYNSSVSITHDGHIAAVTLHCVGDRRASDIRLRLVRKGGLRFTLLYNLLTPEWEVLMMDALVGSEGGLPVAISLVALPRPRQQQQQQQAGGSAAECEPCQAASSGSSSSQPAASG